MAAARGGAESALSGLPGWCWVLHLRPGWGPPLRSLTHVTPIVGCPIKVPILLCPSSGCHPKPHDPVGIRPPSVVMGGSITRKQWHNAGHIMQAQCMLATVTHKIICLPNEQGLTHHLFQRLPCSTPSVYLFQASTGMWKWLRLIC